MLVKAFAVSLVILSIYFLGRLLQALIGSTSQQNQGFSFNIGCYQAKISLDESNKIQQYLLNLSNEVAPYSVSEAKKYKEKVEGQKERGDVANILALQFKKYITAYEKIKSLNQYEEHYNRGLRQARDTFLECRDHFLQENWDCEGSYAQYLQTDQEFALIKQNLGVLIQQKYAEQQKIENILQAEETNDEEGYENYRKQIEGFNKETSRYQKVVKEKNDTFMGLQSKEAKLTNDMETAVKQVEECQRNKKEIQLCKVVSERIAQAFQGIDLKEFQNRVEAKRKIIDKYNSAMIKSNKLGQDTSDIKAQLTKNIQQLNKLQEIYSEAEILSICSGEFIKKCSDQYILELEVNVTAVRSSLESVRALKAEVKAEIESDEATISKLLQMKEQLTTHYQSSLGSIDKTKEIQLGKSKKLTEYKENFNQINLRIAAVQKDIAQADQNRRNAIKMLDSVLGRVGGLANCLSKKEYLAKLQSKRPKHREQDQKLKRQAAQKLIRLLRGADGGN